MVNPPKTWNIAWTQHQKQRAEVLHKKTCTVGKMTGRSRIRGFAFTGCFCRKRAEKRKCLNLNTLRTHARPPVMLLCDYLFFVAFCLIYIQLAHYRTMKGGEMKWNGWGVLLFGQSDALHNAKKDDQESSSGWVVWRQFCFDEMNTFCNGNFWTKPVFSLLNWKRFFWVLYYAD